MDARRLLTAVFAGLWFVMNAGASGELRIDVEPGPFTIEQALQSSRIMKKKYMGDYAVLHLKAGVYRLVQPVVLRPEDRFTTIVADGDVTISGAVEIRGWQRQGKLWVADVPLFNGRPLEFRQLWVNGEKAVRARDVADFEQMHKILGVDKPREILYVPAAAVKPLIAGKPYKVDKAAKNYEFSSSPELVLHEMWCVAVLRMKGIKVWGDTAAVTFHQPESHVHFMHPWPSPMVTPGGEHNSPFYLSNDKQLLDQPGEWYLDTQGRKLYYHPRPGEDMRTAMVEAPALETLVRVEGTADRPVEFVTFEGITFSHATWLRPSLQGHAPLQAGMFLIEAFKISPALYRPDGDHLLDNQGWVGRPSAAVSVNGATSVCFRHCTFRHLGSTALDYDTFTERGTIEGCTFHDIGGTAILAGSFGGEAHEAHFPYNPADGREICRGLSIKNNTITDAANEDWGCVGIGAGYVKGIRIQNNLIDGVSYTGISLGWGWNQQPCAMADNRVERNIIRHYARHMYDTAGIYTLGCQPHTFIQDNVVSDIFTPSYVHDPEHWFYLYTDEGSSGITVKNNWTPAEKFLKNANGPGNTWENNGPQVSDSIKALAGPQRPPSSNGR